MYDKNHYKKKSSNYYYLIEFMELKKSNELCIFLIPKWDFFCNNANYSTYQMYKCEHHSEILMKSALRFKTLV